MLHSKRQFLTYIAIFSFSACYPQLAAADDDSAEPTSGTAVPPVWEFTIMAAVSSALATIVRNSSGVYGLA